MPVFDFFRSALAMEQCICFLIQTAFYSAAKFYLICVLLTGFRPDSSSITPFLSEQLKIWRGRNNLVEGRTRESRVDI